MIVPHSDETVTAKWCYFCVMRALLLFLLLLPNCLDAGWTLIKQFTQPVSSGYFFDAKRGIIGTCNSQFIARPQIWRTSDGGITWQQSTTPIVDDARLSSIFMKDNLIGYASVMADASVQGLWKTTDGGQTWFDHTQNNNFNATCVFATPTHLIVTSWLRGGGRTGGSSSNDGRTYSQTLKNSMNSYTNGIDFVDDLRGVVTPGPYNFFNNNDIQNPCLFTTDGGMTWSEGGDISESWGIYALKGTMTFFALPEGNQSDDQTRVVRTADIGRTWSTLYTFPSAYDFTGHIAGKANTLYVQTADNRGMYRSDNLGESWKSVGGPSNGRDTRFVVTGCSGEVVYAFDDNGGVWKTTDGGDGTLLSGGGTDFTLSFDSLVLTTVCANVRDWLPIQLGGCSDTITIDELLIENDTTSQFSVDTLSANLLSATGEVLLAPILYSPGAPGTQVVRLRIRAHTSAQTIDTTVTITGRTVKLPVPYVPDIERGVAGDTVAIPIYLDPTTDPFSITEYEVKLNFNTDLLEAIGFDTIGTLTRMIRSFTFTPQADGLKCRFSLWRAITESSELALPLIFIRARVYLTSEATTMATVDSFNTISGIKRTSLLGCDSRTSSFTINLLCGDSTLLAFMKTGEVRITGMRPNPNAVDALQADISMPAEGEASLEAVSALGIAGARYDLGRLQKGMNAVKFSTEQLASGLYYLKLTTPFGMVRSSPVIIVR